MLLPSHAALLAAGLALPPLPAPPVPVPPGSRCALTGHPLADGYSAQSILPSSTGDPLDVLGGDVRGWLSPAAARVLAGDWNLGSRALFVELDGTVTVYYPRLAGGTEPEPAPDTGEPPSSKKLKTLARDGRLPRPLWRDLVRDIWPGRAGQTCLLLLAADPKKRVWYKARVGTLGAHTLLYLFDGARHEKRSVSLDWPELLRVLDLVETIYAAGFTKRGIETFLPSETKAVSAVGMAQAMAWETLLTPLRPSSAFKVSILIAQKPEIQKPEIQKPEIQKPEIQKPEIQKPTGEN